MKKILILLAFLQNNYGFLVKSKTDEKTAAKAFLDLINSNQAIKNHLEKNFKDAIRQGVFEENDALNEIQEEKFKNMEVTFLTNYEFSLINLKFCSVALPNKKIFTTKDQKFILEEIIKSKTNCEKTVLDFIGILHKDLVLNHKWINIFLKLINEKNIQKKYFICKKIIDFICNTSCNEEIWRNDILDMADIEVETTVDNESLNSGLIKKYHAIIAFKELIFQPLFNLKCSANKFSFNNKQPSLFFNEEKETSNLKFDLEKLRLCMKNHENIASLKDIIHVYSFPQKISNFQLFNNKPIYQDDNLVREMINHEVFSEQELINLGFEEDFIQNSLQPESTYIVEPSAPLEPEAYNN